MERQIPSESLSLSEGCEIEISYKNNSNESVWYKAIIEAKPPKNSTFKELCVRLLKEDVSTPLNELRDKVLIRPIPPKNVQDCIDIEIGTFVDADYKDAWWAGFVVKVIDDDKFWVCFDSPPDIIQFDRNHLTPHLQWVDEKIFSWWIRGSTRNSEFLKRLSEEPRFSPGTMVELCSKRDEGEVVWVPAMVFKEFKENDEYRYIVKDRPLIGRSYRTRPNKTVDLRSLRPIPPPIRVKEYQLEDYIEVYHDGIGWRQGRVVETRGGVMESLSQRWCTLLIEATKKQLTFKKSDLRPLRVWEDGLWKTRESSLTQGSGDKTEAETQRKTFPKKTLSRNQNGSGNDSTQENENSNRKRKREENLCSVSSVEENKVKDTTTVLLFEKKLPIWKILDSMEVFKAVPQSPHFSPLAEIREDSREMLAVGMMLTFSCLLEQVKALQHDENISSFISLSNSFTELETHGFNVQVAQLRINKLLTLRGMQSKKLDELNGAKKVTADKESVKAENERKILELQRLNEEMDKEIAQSMSCEAKIVQQLDDMKLEFHATASAPW
ncbi:agenet domain-containing protein [Arabidopsis lyrata subsp. lyrata]|uniref:Agenet domain-containing protein n=1 Tax=Arabidopsis lyrata subsp. lyrata TaxID=81972 RepID=D7M2D2_ARALL|nr:agenet domain-containing protein [Arabidopsis lyrata subsp. lyrata]